MCTCRRKIFFRTNPQMTKKHLSENGSQKVVDLFGEVLAWQPSWRMVFLAELAPMFTKGFIDSTLTASLQQIFIASLLKIVCILIAVAYFTIAERKVMAAIQRRKGPNVVGFWGLLQPLADGAKLMFKELLIPTRANAIIFLVAPIMVLILSMISWSIIPSGLALQNSTTPYVEIKVLHESWEIPNWIFFTWLQLRQILVMVFYFF